MLTKITLFAKQPLKFIEYTQALTLSLNELGHQVTTEKDQNTDINFFIAGVYPLLSNFLSNNKPRKKDVLILLEYWQDENRHTLVRKAFNTTIDIFKSQHEKYKNSIYCPPGWSPAYETDLMCHEEDADCLTYGAFTRFRQETTKQHKIKFQQEYTIGQKRNKNILRSKINLIIPAHPPSPFAHPRYLLFACKKKFVLTFPHLEYNPYIPDKHFKVIKDFKKDYNYWLEATEERHKFAEEVYRDLKTNYRNTDFLAEALNKL